jgi:NAD+ synthase
MANALNISIMQMNPVVGDIRANQQKIREFRQQARNQGSDIIVFTEFCIGGYPPEDLVRKPAFEKMARRAIDELASDTADGGPAMVVGGPRLEDGKLFNSLFLLDGGEIAAIRDKYQLPNYGVFDEKRVFDSGTPQGPVTFRGVSLGLMVCEDLWIKDVSGRLYESGADILIAPHGSPFEAGKINQRLKVSGARVVETGLPTIMLNQVGGQDELVFDGSSHVLNGDGSVVAQLASFEEQLLTLRLVQHGKAWRFDKAAVAEEMDTCEALYNALVLGLRDYVGKNNFPGVLIGMSGGLDSALTAAIAVDALGAEKVHLIMMPSRYTSDESLKDARECAELLGARYDSIAIEPIVEAYDTVLTEIFEGREPDATEENLQARIRGNILMALSNKFGKMVIATGNKSEMSVGYSTLYGDLCGGFALLKDLYKTTAYQLCDWRNANIPSLGLGHAGVIIPENIITKAPTAELRENQKDQDSLPPYDVLDAILAGLVEGEKSVANMVAEGFERETVARIEHMLYIAEYKRRQAPPGVKLTRKQFGRDRRYPITNRFRDAAQNEQDQ